MKVFLLVCSASGLILTIIPPVLFFFTGTVDLGWVGRLMTLGMLLWFAGDVPRVLASIPTRRQ